jgi:hypothetical protein
MVEMARVAPKRCAVMWLRTRPVTVLLAAAAAATLSVHGAAQDPPEGQGIPLVTVMDLMLDGDLYAGQRVRVQGEAQSGHGNLRKETRRGKDDWVLRDDCCDAWVTSADGKPPAPPKAEHGLDVVGGVEVEGRTVYILAETVSPTPPRPKPSIRLAVTDELGKPFIKVCEEVKTRVNLIGEVPPVPMRWYLRVEDEEIASGGVPFRYEGVPQREFEVEARLMYEHYLGMSRAGAERAMLTGNQYNRIGQKELHFELRVEEEDTGVVVVTGMMDVLAGCDPPSCYPDRGCLQPIQ